MLSTRRSTSAQAFSPSTGAVATRALLSTLSLGSVRRSRSMFSCKAPRNSVTVPRIFSTWPSSAAEMGPA